MSNNLTSNYRLVSVLPYYFKVKKNMLQILLLISLERINNIFEYQFGLNKAHFTNHAVALLTEKVSHVWIVEK